MYRLILGLLMIFSFSSCELWSKLNEEPDSTPKVIVSTEKLNVRSSPSEQANVQFQVDKDSILTVLDTAKGNEWYHIEFNNKRGYASAEFLENYTAMSNWKEFWIVFGISFIAGLIIIGGLKTQISDGRFSDGTRDGDAVFGCGGIILIGLILSICCSLLWVKYFM
jgi:uncharacterized protein YgiM (DUF1202 family)